MSDQYLLDTNVLSDHLSKKPNPGVLAGFERHPGAIYTAAPVWHELWHGCRRLPRSRRRSLIERSLVEVVQATIPILPYDQLAADWHASERARLEGRGLTPSFVDGQIAAIAAVHGLVVVTSNVDDFARFTGIEVENWRK